MSDHQPSATADTLIVRLRAARDIGAVLKLRLLNLKSSSPDMLVFAFEGDDDKIIYGQWIRRIRPGIRYEPFPCGGKKGVRALKNLLVRDLGNAEKQVFFFVDRDFDDLRGFTNTSNVFMTDSYSVENYLVEDEVLEELLRDEFPCHARPDLRKSIVNIFKNDYRVFLEFSASFNRRIFYARRIPVSIISDLPTSIRHLATVQIGNVSKSDRSVDEVIVLEREPVDNERLALDIEFEKLEPTSRYRGKFAFKFFTEWLRMLADEYKAGKLGTFGIDPLEGEVRRAELVLSNFATKSRLPSDLPTFVLAII